MTITSYYLGIAAALVILVIVVELLRRRQLRERHAVWWLGAGLLALLAGVFPVTLEWAAQLVGIKIPTNLVFFVSIAILFLVCLQHSSELTRVEERCRNLAESVALLELRLRQVEGELSSGESGSESDTRSVNPDSPEK
ncbi:DUF2304 domain-containing protein [Cryobacterium sp. 10I1]|uniref:DUF2304 domain-containing protein n=1 Tax=unclassified Cryobacterium TaxID=2649013 RepID=UPI002B235622|nr:MULTISPECIES: DUF2304 domain-containing protein [unclassified Cryobacterium]MEB0001332.1 DUF2304 domain-containing protein [Cryobacterium sp. RTC2.1]MEB0303954.1 DUF2304 domain-containing protein [Cryobacterium sp. 10I1]